MRLCGDRWGRAGVAGASGALEDKPGWEKVRGVWVG